MKYYSLNKTAPSVSFRTAVIQGIAPDKGLYFPSSIRPIGKGFFERPKEMDRLDLAYHAIAQFVGSDIPEKELKAILETVLDFDFPLNAINGNVASLELYHGPTMAFKDVGARFMAQCLGHFSKDEKQEVTVLVATSGDTGGAVANGFLGVDGVKVVILYPKGMVSDIQERQLTTLGQNITALRVEGTFDDCQAMVKNAFIDPQITESRRLTSANSINVARWLPQQFYFLFAYQQAHEQGRPLVFSVPSGNFGNICAGMVAQKLGMPVHHFIAATNKNDTVPRFMQSQKYAPKPGKATISNAMDVGDPSNFIRIRELFNDQFEHLEQHFSSFAFSDEATKEAMKTLYRDYGYIADPHGAVGYLGLLQYMKEHPQGYGIFLETAHPVKFKETVEGTLDTQIHLPPQIQNVMDRKKHYLEIADYDGLKSFLRSD